MPEIKCPKCGQVFTVDESGYAAIVAQVRDAEFQNAILEKIKQLEQEKQSELKLLESTAKLDKEQSISTLNQKVASLEAQLDTLGREKDLEKAQSISKLQQEIEKLKAQISSQEKDTLLKEQNLKENYELRLKEKDTQIEFYKDLKTKMSTKMVGETLEQHCEIEFNKLRATGFQKAYFEKDNDARTGSKGDYIYRESTEDGVEFISIMFEMKNEMDKTATKHKNEDFLKELDKDRQEKGCEYAVLVSLLEADNELYNCGIVDVSHKYQKMYIIRP